MFIDSLLFLSKFSKMRYFSIFFLAVLAACQSTDVSKKKDDFREFKVIDSQYISKQDVFEGVLDEVLRFRESEIGKKSSTLIGPYVLEKSIPEIHTAIAEGKFTYEQLTLYYLSRIYEYDRLNKKAINSVIRINPEAIEQAKKADSQLKDKGTALDIQYSMWGIPVLVKDNINVSGIATTAGAVALLENDARDAKIITRLKEEGAVILGKANLSEWAYYFCGDCPSGWSAVGGQTLNPYGPRKFDTGGSSSGSGASVAANFAAVAIGSETAGSILSPSSQHALVGYKPTVGTLSGSGIVPISSYLDTAGPMAKNVMDNAILLNAMTQNVEVISKKEIAGLYESSLKGKRFGVFAGFQENSLFSQAIKDIESLGATVVVLEEKDVSLDGFISLLDQDMKRDLPNYFMGYANQSYRGYDLKRLVNFNKIDSVKTMPYGQRLFDNMIKKDLMSEEELQSLKRKLTTATQDYFYYYTRKNNLDGFISINNYTAAQAAVAFFPAMTVSMGYDDSGQPYGLTFIAPTEEDALLFKWAAAYEKATNHRQAPKGY